MTLVAVAVRVTEPAMTDATQNLSFNPEFPCATFYGPVSVASLERGALYVKLLAASIVSRVTSGGYSAIEVQFHGSWTEAEIADKAANLAARMSLELTSSLSSGLLLSVAGNQADDVVEDFREQISGSDSRSRSSYDDDWSAGYDDAEYVGEQDQEPSDDAGDGDGDDLPYRDDEDEDQEWLSLVAELGYERAYAHVYGPITPEVRRARGFSFYGFRPEEETVEEALERRASQRYSKDWD